MLISTGFSVSDSSLRMGRTHESQNSAFPQKYFHKDGNTRGDTDPTFFKMFLRRVPFIAEKSTDTREEHPSQGRNLLPHTQSRCPANERYGGCRIVQLPHRQWTNGGNVDNTNLPQGRMATRPAGAAAACFQFRGLRRTTCLTPPWTRRKPQKEERQRKGAATTMCPLETGRPVLVGT